MLPIDTREFLIIVHIIGTAIGVGGASVSYYLFFRFYEDVTVSSKEMEVLHLMSWLVTGGLIVLVASGIGFFLLDTEPLSNPKVLAKLTVVAIVFVNAQVMHRKVFPIFATHLDTPLEAAYLAKKVPLIFTTGAISGISWYTALVLGGWRSINFEYPYWVVFGGYLLVLLVGIAVSNAIGQIALRRLRESERKLAATAPRPA
ncbi:MAG: hypothetical protein M3277_08000 [Actinomycetota bacterium]|nr:hypothetical protein [Actinomycetota bacterium]